MLRVGLFGWYGHGNVGDDALLQVAHNMLDELSAQCEIIVVADNPSIIHERYGYLCIRPLPLSFRCWIKEWKICGKTFAEWVKLDALVLGGGGFFADDVSLKNVIKWSAYILIARLLRIRVYGYCLGVGPLNRLSSRILARIAFGTMDRIVVRDGVSRDWLVSTGSRKKIFVSVDPVFNFKSDTQDAWEILEAEQVPLGRPYIVISIPPFFHDSKRWPGQHERWVNYCKSWAELIEHIIKWGVTPIFLPMQHCPAGYGLFSDIDCAESIADMTKCKDDVYILRRELSPNQVASVLGGAALVVAMRLHAVILAAVSGAAVSGAVYHHKVGEVVKNLGLEEYFIDVNELNADNLKKVVDSAWHDRNMIKNRVQNSLPDYGKRIIEAQTSLTDSLRSLAQLC